jgi:hypothetical protein
MALFDVSSVQYGYRAHPRFEAIVGVAHVNVKMRDRSDTVIGRMHAPTPAHRATVVRLEEHPPGAPTLARVHCVSRRR